MQPLLTLSRACKWNEDSYMCILFNYLNHPAPSHIKTRQKHTVNAIWVATKQSDAWFLFTSMIWKSLQWFLLCFCFFCFWEAWDLNVWYRRKSLSDAEGGTAASAILGRRQSVRFEMLHWWEKVASTHPAEKIFDVRTADANYAKTSELVWQPTCLAACNTRGNGKFIPRWQIPIRHKHSCKQWLFSSNILDVHGQQRSRVALNVPLLCF